MVIESKSGKTSVLDAFMGIGVGGEAWGVDGSWMPLPTRPQQYCDPESLVNLSVMVLREEGGGLWAPAHPSALVVHKIFAFSKCLSFNCNAKGCFRLFLKAH